MKKEALENINMDLFNSFNPEEKLWIIGGTGSTFNSLTRSSTTVDVDPVADYDWSELEDAGAQ